MHGQGGHVEGQAPHVKGAHNWPPLKQIRMIAHLHRQIRMCRVAAAATSAAMLLDSDQDVV